MLLCNRWKPTTDDGPAEVGARSGRKSRTSTSPPQPAQPEARLGNAFTNPEWIAVAT